ncbi:MAG: hypothetical protein ABI328_05720 [Gemmatimonadaceae bacterium]
MAVSTVGRSLALIGLVSTRAHVAAARVVAQPVREACTATAQPPVPLRAASGEMIYVEATTFVAQGNEVLLSGRPTYLSDGKQSVRRNNTFGITRVLSI